MNEAHGLRLEHPVFTAPLAVEVKLDHREENLSGGYEGGTWLVHEKTFPEIDPGLVSDGHGFEDSPDCERIAGGVGKGPTPVAIGRQANLLQWGFYGAPDRMTDSAKRAFLNAIVWMRRFEGHVPIAKKEAQARTWLRQWADTIAAMTPEELAQRTDKDSYTMNLLDEFPAETWAEPFDPAKPQQWYAANEEFVGPGADRHSFAFDEDLAAVKVGNRKPEFLDWLLATFAKSPRDAQALRLAQRYLGEPGKTAAATKKWIQANREFLFFSDTAGFRWLVDVNAQRAKAKARAAGGAR